MGMEIKDDQPVINNQNVTSVYSYILKLLHLDSVQKDAMKVER